ncbi:MAG: hypothetical protein Kow00129_07520 [Thermoleophilia bacterium]
MTKAETGVKVMDIRGGRRNNLADGSWVCELLSRTTTGASKTTLGFSVWKPGARTPQMVHETEELAFIVSGRGKLAVGSEEVSYGAGQAVYIPAGVPHGVVNDSEEDMSMVYVFAHPEYPPTKPANDPKRDEE